MRPPDLVRRSRLPSARPTRCQLCSGLASLYLNEGDRLELGGVLRTQNAVCVCVCVCVCVRECVCACVSMNMGAHAH